MDKTSIVNLLYVVASVFFIFGIKMLGKTASARKGNFISGVGMLIAICTALISAEIINWTWLVAGLAIGTIIGVIAAKKVGMTAMPEMVALFNGSGGLASLLVSWAEYERILSTGVASTGGKLTIIVLTVLVGGLTFTGSIMAWGKLSEKISGRPIQYPGQNIVNSLLLVVMIAGVLLFGFLNPLLASLGLSSYFIFLVLVGLSLLLGILFVLPIGGGDMPVVISLLNSYSGIAACAAGFVIFNNVLIVAGALVGSSGIILTTIMCKAMNRSLSNVLFSGFGSGVTSSKKQSAVTGEVKPISVEDSYLLLEAASNVLIVPGYGMAVAQAQHAVQELTELLEDNGCEINFGIHPVAGRMPGHMNVLLAEANVPYEKLLEMDSVNPTIENVDVVIVIGANDVVNPDAREDKSSPLYGMPIIEVDKAKTVIVLKRSMRPGFSGAENPLFFGENTRMLFGDAKASIQGLASEFKSE